jgi:hypothetical protein
LVLQVPFTAMLVEHNLLINLAHALFPSGAIGAVRAVLA